MEEWRTKGVRDRFDSVTRFFFFGIHSTQPPHTLVSLARMRSMASVLTKENCQSYCTLENYNKDFESIRLYTVAYA